MGKACLYLIGIPGSGKTTLVRTALAGVPVQACKVGIMPYLRYPGGIELGAIRPPLGGTDALELRIQPHAIAWLKTVCPYTALLAEGDRLANGQFFHALCAMGWVLTVAYLRCPPEIAARRRANRPLVGKRARDRQGAEPPAAWLKGRITKVERLAAAWAACCWHLDARLPIDHLAALLRSHPVCQQLVCPEVP